MLLGWYRFVCANGLVVGATRSQWRLVHREGMMPADVAPLLQAGLELAEREKTAIREWRATPVAALRLAAFADERLAPGIAGRLVNDIRALALMCGPLPEVAASPDPDDDFLLATAQTAGAEFLVTGDKSGFLALRKHGASSILSAQAFLGLLDRS